MLKEHVPRAFVDVIEAVALPTTSPAEVQRAISSWNFINQSRADVRAALQAADMSAMDLVLVELSTERATLDEVTAAFTAQQFAPCSLVEAIRLVAANEHQRWQRFQLICLGSVAETALEAPVVDCAGGNTVVLMDVPLYDNETRPDLGWSDRSFTLARHRRAPAFVHQ
jgi:hypothetical protein